MASAVFVGCNNSYNGNGNGNGGNGIPPIDGPCEYCDNDTRPMTAERNKDGLQLLVDGWIDAEKCVCYNPYGWDGLQAAIGMAQRVLDYPVSDEQIGVAVDLFIEAVGWLNSFWFMGFSDSFISVNMTEIASMGGGRVFVVEDFLEIELSHVNNILFIIRTQQKLISLNLVEHCKATVLYGITLLRIRYDVYSAQVSIRESGN